VVVSAPVTPNAVLTHFVRVAQYNGYTNLSDSCAVNKIATTRVVAPPPTPEGYCGTVQFPASAGLTTARFIASVAPSGKVYGVLYGAFLGNYVYGAMEGTVSSGNLSGAAYPSGTVTGTVQGGSVSGTISGTQFGELPFVGSTIGCS
jgi:hypothetical protein